jgi:adenylate kinase
VSHGAGKGTQAELLVKHLNIPTVSSGVLFRTAMKERTPLGLQAQAYMDRGELVPDEITIGMVAERLQQPDCANGVILDGFPRTVAQAEALDGVLAKMGRQVDAVLYVQVAFDELLTRWLVGGRVPAANGLSRALQSRKGQGVCDACGGALTQRADDTPETQRRRIQVYLEQTSPLEAHYDPGAAGSH